mmetsp:Transcript_79038/g.155051  ORF Transcript_79038/g.155051 Transcript_79038/m.155051 type:complete len:151 (+) Transcript_79038:89-541(+)
MLLSKALILIFLSLVASFVAGILKEDCASHGFNVAVLSCETCELMQKILDHGSTYDNCKTCCIEKVEETYEQAVLEVDKRFLEFLKDLSEVIKIKKELNLKVRYRNGIPTLLMYKNKGDSRAAESIAVGSWDKNTFVEYLGSHLKAASKP